MTFWSHHLLLSRPISVCLFDWWRWVFSVISPVPQRTYNLDSIWPPLFLDHTTHTGKKETNRERERQRQHAHNAERERGGWIGGLRSIKYLQHRQRGKTEICKCWGCSIDLHKDTRQEPDWGLVIKHQISWLLILILTMCVSPGVVMEEVTRLVSTGDTVKIWDAVSMAPLDQFNPHSISHPVAQACWSSNSILVGGWVSVWVEGFLKPKVFFGRPAVKNLKISLFSLLSNKKNKFSPLRSCLLGMLA